MRWKKINEKIIELREINVCLRFFSVNNLDAENKMKYYGG